MFQKSYACLAILILTSGFSNASAQCNPIDAVTSASFRITGGEACETFANLNWTFTKSNGQMTIEWGTSTSYGTSKSVYSAKPVNLPNLTPDTKYYYHVFGVYQNKTYQYTTSSFTTSGGAAANKPPVITSATTVTCTTGTSQTYTVTATDQDNDPVTFTVSGQPSWITFASPVLTLKPVAGNTNTVVRIIAADGKGGLDTLSLAVTVVTSTSISTAKQAASNRAFCIGTSRIIFPYTTGHPVTVSLYSLNGTTIMQRTVPVDALEQQKPPAGIVPGTYLVQMKTATYTGIHTINIRK